MTKTAPGAMTVDGLGVTLGGREILKGVSLAFQPGQVTAVVGPNGAGKSTFLTCLAGLRRPDAGEVRLGGRLLGSLGDRLRAQTLGYLPQTPEIAWRLDVDAFVRLGRTAHRGVFGASADDVEAVREALAATRLTSLADRDITTLSGGERARALMARALAGSPQWLVADEPLTGLDPAHQLDAAAMLQRFAAAGGGVVVTLHDLTFAVRTADRIVVLSSGEVVSDGPKVAALGADVLDRVYRLNARWVQGEGGPLLDIVGRDG